MFNEYHHSEAMRSFLSRVCVFVTILFFLALAWKTANFAQSMDYGYDNGLPQNQGSWVYTVHSSKEKYGLKDSYIQDGVYCQELESFFVFATESRTNYNSNSNSNLAIRQFNFTDNSWSDVVLGAMSGQLIRKGGTFTVFESNVNGCKVFGNGGADVNGDVVEESVIVKFAKEENGSGIVATMEPVANDANSVAAFGSSAVLYNETVLIFGGITGDVYSQSKFSKNNLVNGYNITLKSWVSLNTTADDMLLNRFLHSSSLYTVNKQSYVILYGGFKNWDSVYSDLLLFDLQSLKLITLLSDDTEESLKSSFYARAKSQMIIDGDNVYIYGGETTGYGASAADQAKVVSHTSILVTTLHDTTTSSVKKDHDVEAYCFGADQGAPFCTFFQGGENDGIYGRAIVSSDYDQTNKLEDRDLVFAAPDKFMLLTKDVRDFVLLTNNQQSQLTAGTLNVLIEADFGDLYEHLFIYVPYQSDNFFFFRLILLVSVISFLIAAILLMVQRPRMSSGNMTFAVAGGGNGNTFQHEGVNTKTIKMLPIIVFDKKKYLEQRDKNTLFSDPFDFSSSSQVEPKIHQPAAGDIEMSNIRNVEPELERSPAAVNAPDLEKAMDDISLDEQIEEEGICCAICLTDFEDGEQCRVLPCHHIFHPDCVDGWLERNNFCPLCKRHIVKDDGTLNLLQSENLHSFNINGNASSTENARRSISSRIIGFRIRRQRRSQRTQSPTNGPTVHQNTQMILA